MYVGATFPGKKHDYGMLKKEFAPGRDWFSTFDVLADLGYLGLDKDYRAKNIFLPHKKQRKSKNNPNPQLTQIQKNENKELSKKRVVVENVIGGMKRFRCLADRCRNHLHYIKDLFVLLAAGLWNFNVVNRA